MTQVSRNIFYKDKSYADSNTEQSSTHRFNRRMYVNILHAGRYFFAILSKILQKVAFYAVSPLIWSLFSTTANRPMQMINVQSRKLHLYPVVPHGCLN